MIKIAVFASGEGTNLQALLDACKSRRIRGEISLVIVSSEQAGALLRAQRAKVPVEVLKPKDFRDSREYNTALASRCGHEDITLICLAGFMHRLQEPLLGLYPGRIMNVHPALLPAFGGKGMYGMHVHEAVLESGVRVSGCTVHFVDDILDNGPVILQSPVPVFPGDMPATLAARVRVQEHWAYPEAVRLFCERRLELRGRTVSIRPSSDDGSPRLRRALVSVSDKTGLIEFCRGLEGLGIEVVSTSGTAKVLREEGVEVRSLDTMTGFPEILNGRVKTLHPKIHGGILFRRRDPEQVRESRSLGIEPIDMVVANLYPFARAAAQATHPFSRDVIENIDIGGVTLIRAAAKNFEDVAIVVSPGDYTEVLRELESSQGELSPETRQRLAIRAFQHTAEYDAMICRSWGKSSGPGGLEALQTPEGEEKFPSRLELKLDRAQTLRYGENPHQRAAVYQAAVAPRGKTGFEQLQGKELSYNNLLDAAGAWEAVSEFSDPAAVLFKHVTPCGMGTGRELEEGFERAWACDPLSAFGGVMAVNRVFPASIARSLANRFMEVIIAPGFETEALELLKKKPKLRLLVRGSPPSDAPQLRSIGDLVLVTEPDRQLFGPDWKVVTRRRPAAEEEAALRFAWAACKHVKSNAIVLSGTRSTVGIGAGQMSRVDAVHIAGVKLKMYLKDNPKPEPLVLASDAFFPFRDGLDAAATLGISAVIQPGGSVRDEEVIAAADERGLTMIFTGMRHFRH